MKRWTAKEIEAVLSQLPLRSPIPRISDRAEWGQLQEKEAILAEAQKLLCEPISPLPATVYLRTTRDGNRSEFEKVSFGRRHRLRTLVLASAVAGDDRFLDPLIDIWFAICDESTWYHPAHDLGLEEFQGTGRGIDLMAAQTGYDLAESDHILGDLMPGFVRTRTRVEVEERIFSRYLSDAEAGYGWRNGHNNWTAVCAGNIAGTALYLMEDKARLAALLERVLASLDLFIRNAFCEDGASNEGVGYWTYGFGHYVLIADLLRRATDGKIDLLDDEKVRSISLFPLCVQLAPGLFPAFADCGRGVRIGPWLSGFLAEETGDEGWRSYAHREASTGARGFSYRNLFSAEVAEGPEPEFSPLDYLPDSQIWIVRSPRMAVAAKGGYNAENHNHNDLGSFMMVVDGEVLVAEIGAPVYTRDTFNEHRYECPAINSWGHSVPVVCGYQQSEGPQAAAQVVAQQDLQTESIFTLELARAYPEAARLRSLLREFKFSRSDAPTLVLTDTFDWQGQAGTWEEAIITFAEVEPLERGVLLRGERATLRVECSIPVVVRVDAVEVETRDGAIPYRVALVPEAPSPERVRLRFGGGRSA